MFYKGFLHFFVLLCLVLLASVPAAQARQSVGGAATGGAGDLPFAIEGPPAPPPPGVVARDAEGRTTIRATRLAAPLRLDGALDEAIYSDVPAVGGFVQVEPRAGEAPTERTEVWLSFDDEHFYITLRCWDSAPERRISTEMRRDVSNFINGNDIVNIFIDPFYDRRNGISFTLNAIGARNDGQQIGNQYNADWNPIWDHATGEFDGGWTVEMALPFRSLRYRPGRAQIWGLNVLRVVRWKNELSVLSPVPPGRGYSSAQYAPLTATVVGIEAPVTSRNLDVKPFAVSSSTTDRGAGLSNDIDGDVGLDVKYAFTRNLVADLTYNTDFAQVEADEQQVNLTRFSLFFPEKREFFLENRDTFSFGGVGNNGDAPVLFYSRRIGLDGGRPVPIEGGGRLTGRIGAFNVGVLNIQTDDVPAAGTRGTNFSVVRLKRDILRQSSVGAIATRRSISATAPGDNLSYGVDGTFNFFNDLAINTYWARTQTEARRDDDISYRAQLDLSGDRYGVQLERMLVGQNFNPEMGFVRRPDVRRTLAEFRFSPRPQSIQSVRRFWWLGSVDYFEAAAGQLESREQRGEFAIEFSNADRFSLTLTDVYEFIPRPFRIGGEVTLPVGGYNWQNARLGYNVSPQRRLAANLAVEYGTFYNGHRAAFSASRGRAAFGPHFAVEPNYSLNRIDLVQGEFTTHLLGSRFIATMTPRMFVSALVQYNTSNNSASANVRLRWEYQPGSELFVVYNDDRDTRASGFPELTTRSFIVKVNRLLRF
jgi:hypothetical protein